MYLLLCVLYLTFTTVNFKKKKEKTLRTPLHFVGCSVVRQKFAVFFFSLHQLSCSSFTLNSSFVHFLIILFFTFLYFKGRL